MQMNFKRKIVVIMVKNIDLFASIKRNCHLLATFTGNQIHCDWCIILCGVSIIIL